jgi:PAN domain-containing protein
MSLQAMSFIFGALMLAVGILGGGFEVKEIKISNVTTTVRIFAVLIGMVFVGLGFWQPSPAAGPASVSPPAAAPAPPAAAPAAAAVTMREREHDTDRYGGDYYGFDVNADHVEDCEVACKNDTKCRAWTYVKPEIQSTNARCWLKNVVPASSKNVCCVSGTKAQSN